MLFITKCALINIGAKYANLYKGLETLSPRDKWHAVVVENS
jgi:hypothetical protein